MLSKIIEACQFLLQNYPEARAAKEYLDSRLDQKSQELFGFGYFPNSDNIQVLTNMIGEDMLIQHDLAWPKNIENSSGPRRALVSYFENNPLVMPYRNAYGKTVAIVGRSILSSQDMIALNIELEKNGSRKAEKYKNTKETNAFKKGYLLFGLYEAKEAILKEGFVYVVEGQIDVIKAHERGIKNIVALGTNSMTPYQFSVISRYTNSIILLLDNDSGGDQGRKRIIDQFGKFANIQNFYSPSPYKDIDEYLSNLGDEEVSFVVKV